MNGTATIAEPSSNGKPAWAIFPVQPKGKLPLTEHGFKDASRDPEVQRQWWERKPNANIGIPTGTVNDLVVIDIDPKHGGLESLRELEGEYGYTLPRTVTIETGGDGFHYYLRKPAGVTITSRNGWRPGIDIKAEGGYVVGVESTHASGKKYRFAEGRAFGQVPIADIPDWLLTLLPQKSEPPKCNNQFTITDTGVSILQRAQSYVAAADPASEGNRNDSAFRLSGHVAAFGRMKIKSHSAGGVERYAIVRHCPDGELCQCVPSAFVNGKPREAKDSGNQAAGDSHDNPTGESLLSDLLPMSKFVRQSHHIEYLIPFCIVAGQPGVISARTKSLKTTVAIDANISLATATPFLGFWQVPSPIKCGILSAESGSATIAETIRRIASSKGIIPEEIDNCLVSARCPRLQSKSWLDEIRRVIGENELRCLTIDPTYMAIAGIKQNDLSSVAALLEPVSRIISDTGCAVLMVHHNRKVSEMRYGCPTLEEITGSGFAEWARFWLLLNRRREWDDTAGQHWLWFVTGGSAGFGSRKWLDVTEGKPTDAGGRVWEVEVVAAGEGESREKAERERERKEQRDAKLLDDQKAIVEVLRKCEDRRTTKNNLRTRTNLKPNAIAAALAALLDRGDVVPCPVKVGPTNRTCEGFSLHERD